MRHVAHVRPTCPRPGCHALWQTCERSSGRGRPRVGGGGASGEPVVRRQSCLSPGSEAGHVGHQTQIGQPVGDPSATQTGHTCSQVVQTAGGQQCTVASPASLRVSFQIRCDSTANGQKAMSCPLHERHARAGLSRPLYRILPGGGPLGEHRPRQDGRRDRRIDQMQSLAGSRHEQSPLLICTIKSGQDRLPLHHVGCCQQRNVQPHPHQQTAQTFISSRTRDSRAGFSGILFLAGRIGSDRSSRQSALFPPLIPMSLMMTCQPRDAIPHRTGIKPPKGSCPLSSGPWIGTGRACPTSKGRELCTASLVETSQPVVGRCSRR